MEILAFSDIYGDKEIISHLAQQLDGKDRITLVAGDVGIYRRWLKDLERYRRHITEILEKVSSFSRRVYYVPGDTDADDLEIDDERIVNIDKSQEIIDGPKQIGVLGLGGVPIHSLSSQKYTYSWNEKERFTREGLEKLLRINMEKIQIEDPDITVLLSHSPPYSIADKSTPISLKRIIPREDVPSESSDRVSSGSNPKQLGSRVLNRFSREYEVNLHLFGHVHGCGGIHQKINETHYFNVSHLSVDPSRLYGRKFLRINLLEDELIWMYQSVVKPYLDFETYHKMYL